MVGSVSSRGVAKAGVAEGDRVLCGGGGQGGGEQGLISESISFVTDEFRVSSNVLYIEKYHQKFYILIALINKKICKDFIDTHTPPPTPNPFEGIGFPKITLFFPI